MPQQRRFLLSAVTNWLAFAANLLVTFFISPFLIHTLGDSRYGVWVFVESILAYFTLFDLGIAACVVRFTAKFQAANDQQELNRLASSCFALFLGLGSLAFLIGLALMPLFAPTMRESGMELGEIITFSLLMLGNLAMSLPLSVFPSILDGLERFAAKSAARIVFLGLRTAATVVLLEREPSLLGLGIIFTIGNLAENAVMAALCWVQLPKLRFSVRLIDRATLKAVKGYSIDAFLAMVAGRVSVQSGAIVVGIFLGAAEVAWFAIALRLVEFAKAFLRSATMTLTPAISSLDASGNVEAIRQVLFKGTRWVLYLIIPVHLGLIKFGRPFLSIWLGPEYADHCYATLVILSGTLSLVVATSVASRILYGMGLLRRFARASLLEATVNLSLSLILAPRLGLVGVAWASAIPNLLFCLFAIVYVCRLLSISGGAYAGKAWLRPLAAGILPLALWSGGWTTTGWLTLGFAIGAGLLPYAMLIVLIEKAPACRSYSRKALSVLSRTPILNVRRAFQPDADSPASGWKARRTLALNQVGVAQIIGSIRSPNCVQFRTQQRQRPATRLAKWAFSNRGATDFVIVRGALANLHRREKERLTKRERYTRRPVELRRWPTNGNSVRPRSPDNGARSPDEIGTWESTASIPERPGRAPQGSRWIRSSSRRSRPID